MDQADSIWRVCESRVEEISRLFALMPDAQRKRLTHLQRIEEFAQGRNYNSMNHINAPGAVYDVNGEVVDKGYFEYYDELHDRFIYVASNKVALSHSFHVEMKLDGLFNVVKPNGNHEDFADMTRGMKAWWLRNFRCV